MTIKRNPKKPDLTRTLRAVVEAGVQVQRIETDRSGRIVIITGSDDSGQPVEPVSL